MGKFWYIRHGQTPFNVKNNQWHNDGDPPLQNSFQYTSEYIDPPLTEEGRNQILCNIEAIRSLQIEKVHVCDLSKGFWI